MERDCPTHKPNLTSSNPIVNNIAGEPAAVVNGLPDVTPVHSTCQLNPVNQNESDEKNDHHFGEWMEGREVRKLFGEIYYVGKVVRYDRETNWYRVVYEDGDFEDLDWHELEEVLVAIDISYPLKKLALRMIKNDKSVELKGNSGKIREEGRNEGCPKRKTKNKKVASKLKRNGKKKLNRRQYEKHVSGM